LIYGKVLFPILIDKRKYINNIIKGNFKEEMMSIIKTVLDGDWASLKKTIEQKSATIIKDKIQEKKLGVLAKINGITTEQMSEVVAINDDK
tara:strand:- start:19712 stop:19984 length:273 start_codon:yes stop_codon:yes gene_type:complete